MDNSSTDRRVSRTKKAIEDAFVTIVNEKGFASTKVSDIVTQANINRGTFYLHYQDKFDLMEQLSKETLEGLKTQVIQAERQSKQASNQHLDYEHLFILILNYMKKHKKRMLMLLSLEGEYSFRKKLHQLLLENISENLYPFTLKENLQIPLSYWSIYVVNADVGVIEYWLSNGCRDSVNEVASILNRLFFFKYI